MFVIERHLCLSDGKQIRKMLVFELNTGGVQAGFFRPESHFFHPYRSLFSIYNNALQMQAAILLPPLRPLATI